MGVIGRIVRGTSKCAWARCKNEVGKPHKYCKKHRKWGV